MEQAQTTLAYSNQEPEGPGTRSAPLDAAALNARYGHLDGAELLEILLKEVFPGRIAVGSSFGAESVVLLHLVSQVDPNTPILFGDTQKLFPETLAYEQQLKKQLGLTDIRHLKPELSVIQDEDSEGMLWRSDPDQCCALRKVAPFQKGLENFDAWITGRKRFQSGSRSAIEVIEQDGPRIKVNPLARWSPEQINSYILEQYLPEHPLKKHGFLSIGCTTCTRPVAEDEDQRAGRWAGRDKIECGIHFVNGRIQRGGSS